MRGQGETIRCGGKDSNHATTCRDRLRWRPFSPWPVLLGTTDHAWGVVCVATEYKARASARSHPDHRVVPRQDTSL